MNDQTYGPDPTENDTRPIITRRGFLVWLGGFTTGALASYAAGLLPQIPMGSEEHAVPVQPRATLTTVLGHSGKLKFHNGSSHYLVKGTHSDNTKVGEETIRAVSTVVPTIESSDPALFELDANSDWVLVGSPSSNSITRQLLGFDPNALASGSVAPSHHRFR